MKQSICENQYDTKELQGWIKDGGKLKRTELAVLYDVLAHILTFQLAIIQWARQNYRGDGRATWTLNCDGKCTWAERQRQSQGNSFSWFARTFFNFWETVLGQHEKVTSMCKTCQHS